jgi:hypothetical protein
LAAGVIHKYASALMGLAPIFCGRRWRFWIVGVAAGCVDENVVESVVEKLPAGIVATLEYPLIAYAAACELVVDSDTCCDCEVTGVAVAVAIAVAGTVEVPPPPPPPHDANIMLAVNRKGNEHESEPRMRITPYYRFGRRPD